MSNLLLSCIQHAVMNLLFLIQKRVAKKTTAASATSCTEESERLQAARERREAQRNKLKEMRMAAKRAREEATIVQEEGQQEEENVFTTPKKSRIGEFCVPANTLAPIFERLSFMCTLNYSLCRKSFPFILCCR